VKKSRFTAEQLVAILSDAARKEKETKVVEICRKHGAFPTAREPKPRSPDVELSSDCVPSPCVFS